MQPENRRLFKPYTYERTERLLALLDDTESCTQRDIRELFSEFVGGNFEQVGPDTHISLTEFAKWVLGQLDEDVAPCEIFW